MDVSKFLERAEAALRKRMPDQAIALYRQVLVAAPGSAPAREGLMTAYKRRVELKGGASLIDKAAARSLYATALGLKGTGKVGAAVRTCDAGLERHPEDRAMLELLAECLQAQGHKEEALAVWRAELAAAPKDLAALKAAGRLHYELKQVAEATQLLELAHTLDRHDPEVERLRRQLAAEGTLASTRYETAQSSREVMRSRAEGPAAGPAAAPRDADALRAALQASPGDATARRELATLLRGEGHLDEALAVLDEGLATAPGEETLATARAELLATRADAALRAAQARGDAAEVKRLEAERAALEVEDLSRRVASRPGDLALRLRLARACYRAGDTDKAVEHFQATAADPRFKLDSQQGLGACFYRKGLFPLAARQFEAALAAAGGPAGERGKEICYHLGLVSERMNDRPGAYARYLAVYEVDINYRDVAHKIEALKPD
ncbi:MAG TPA: tetratricopeptide repeat protein [Planctomycetota bacterium]|nr:tetratricopeptide repeat protein [Planctomycetota bacterium]